jgi:guanylate kinase
MKTVRKPHPVVLVVSAPSGAGKTTLCHRLLQAHPGMVYSVSSTTRAPRDGEVNGVDYDFLDVETFRACIERQDFLEYAEVHGNYYGTRMKAVMEPFENGRSVLLDVDVEGAAQIRRRLNTDPSLAALRENFVDVFIAPPSLEALRQRLESRAKDTADVIETRMKNAEDEMAEAGAYQFHLLNDELEDSVRKLEAVYLAGTLRNGLPTF